MIEGARVAIVPRGCTQPEEVALSRWTAAYLPACGAWLAARGLHAPAEVIAILRRLRSESASASHTMLIPLLGDFSVGDAQVAESEHDERLSLIADGLTGDLQTFQELIEEASGEESSERFVTSSRDLRRYHRTLSAARWTRIGLAASDLMLVPLISVPRETLYLPAWLLQQTPLSPFAPNESFYRPRVTSLAWLLLDAIVVNPGGEFKNL